MSGSRTAAVGVAVGALGVAAIPVGVAASWRLNGLALLDAAKLAVPVALVLGVCALTLARHARFNVARSVSRKGETVVRVARGLAWSALYLAAIGAIALGFYALLVSRG